ncbi:MAG TPA: glycine--tRNA ligase subunit alpha [Candidatus Polarisedimenticolia bacterium]|jgi:glycyl-tRNA synthetase alpha chain|nr:glycine--tRNA ligase subunit alpha [Candidatus Polarisedimenticolia bacterium]
MALNFQQLILALQAFWAGEGAVVQQPYDVEVGAGTMHPDTFFRVLGPEPWRAAYCSPSRRPVDGRYGQNPFRVYRHYQFQVVLKPSPPDVQEIYLRSLAAFGIEPREHDIRFDEDNWESPTLGAAGVGWQVLMDGMEISQFTYFQQAGGIELTPITAEITYGSERIAMFLNGVANVFDLEWAPGVSYGDVRRQEEIEFSRHNFESADVPLLNRLFEQYETEGHRLLKLGLVLPSYDYALRCSHTFNVLEARGAISVTERTGFIQRVRRLAVACARDYLKAREKLGFPLLKSPAGEGPRP